MFFYDKSMNKRPKTSNFTNKHNKNPLCPAAGAFFPINQPGNQAKRTNRATLDTCHGNVHILKHISQNDKKCICCILILCCSFIFWSGGPARPARDKLGQSTPPAGQTLSKSSDTLKVTIQTVLRYLIGKWTVCADVIGCASPPDWMLPTCKNSSCMLP